MKYLYSFSLLALLLTACGEDEKTDAIDRSKTDWAFYNLNGDVKSISEKSFMMSDTSATKKVPGHERGNAHDYDLEFNKEGLLVFEKKFTKKGEPYEEVKYNGKKNLIQRVQFMNGKAAIKTDYTWSADGNNTRVTRRNADNTQLDRIIKSYNGAKIDEQKTFNSNNNGIDRITYIYDDMGNLKGENLYLGTEEIQYKNLYSYDDNGRKISEERFDKAGNVIYKTTSQYEKDNLIVKETTDSDGKAEYVEKFTYDSKGNMLTRTTYESFDDSETLDKYGYDTNGNIIKWSMLKNDTVTMEVSYKYDDKNNLTEVITYDGNNNVINSTAYTYEYDKDDNWIKKTTVIGGRPQYIVERKIIYY